MKFSFQLPMPPSINSIWRAVSNRVIRSQRYKHWLQEAGLAFLLTGPLPTVQPPVRVSVILHGKLRGDIDNRVKVVLDFIVKRGLLPDDDAGTIHEVRVRHEASATAPYCLVEIEEVEEASAEEAK